MVLVVINKRARQKKVANDYTLQKAYQLHENDVTLKLIFPLSAVHCGIYVVYLGTNTIIRTFFSDAENVIIFVTLLEADHILVCLYTSVPPLAFYAFLRRFEKSYQPIQKPPDETDVSGKAWFQAV
ncbi:hypothetical protein AAVH_07425 [Aphelenchoides avenae]|nr:hypothetical protein AAVH_07425 [Aphelenchus avenae]